MEIKNEQIHTEGRFNDAKMVTDGKFRSIKVYQLNNHLGQKIIPLNITLGVKESNFNLPSLKLMICYCSLEEATPKEICDTTKDEIKIRVCKTQQSS